MINNRKNTTSGAFFWITMIGLIISTTLARAELMRTEVSNRNGDPFGFAVKVDDVWHEFSFEDVVLELDTTRGSTGRATIQGDLAYNGSGEPWTIDASFDNIDTIPGGDFPHNGSAPYPNMLADLFNEGFGSDARLAWNDISLELTPGPGNTNPTFPGAQSYITRSNVHVTGMSHPAILEFRKDLPPADFPGEQFDMFAAGAWFETTVDNPDFGDVHFNFAFAIPEPSAWALLLLGSVCGIFAVGPLRDRRRT